VFPASGLPGSEVKIQGRNWPARSKISVYLGRIPEDDPERDFQLRLANVITSRTGGFEVNAIVPTSAIPHGSNAVFVKASGENAAGEIVATKPVPFNITPYPNRLTVTVADSESGFGVAGAAVKVFDGFGRKLLEAETGADGVADVTGLPPGQVVVKALGIDYLRGEVATVLPQDGQSTLSIELVRSPGLRLYLPAATVEPGGRFHLRGIDRASGLPFEEIVDVSDGSYLPARDSEKSLFFSYVIPSDEAGGGLFGADQARAALRAIGILGNRLASSSMAYPTAVWHIGRTGDTVLAYATDPFQGFVQATTLLWLQPNTGKVLHSKSYSISNLTPAVSYDGQLVYVVHWVSSSVDVLDGTTSKLIRKLMMPSEWTIQAEPSRDGKVLYVVSADDGAIYAVDAETGRSGEPVVVFRGATRVKELQDGKLAIVALNVPQLAIADPRQGVITDVIPLDKPAQWVWADPEGPFIFVGHFTATATVVVELIESASLKPAGVVEFD